MHSDLCPALRAWTSVIIWPGWIMDSRMAQKCGSAVFCFYGINDSGKKGFKGGLYESRQQEEARQIMSGNDRL